MSELRENIRAVRERIEKACARAGRSSGEISLVAVSKTMASERVQEAIDAGLDLFGENRVQDAAPKIRALGGDVTWHMIGHLQRNKVKKAVSLFDMIQSVDSYELAVEIDRRSGEMGKIMDVLVEVNTSAEGTKFGCRPEDSIDLIERMSHLRGITVTGLMTIGAFTDDESVVRKCFVTLRELARKTQEAGISGVEMRYLSMGMTSDFEIAIEEGSNMLRIGTAIFGPRQAR
jgi:pyridoxal phosphate enzyme (YggS family)